MQLITIRSYDNSPEADYDKALLESYGIPVLGIGLTYREVGPIELRVRQEDVPRAIEILGNRGRTDVAP